MTIDLIDFTDTQFAMLSAEQLLEVKEAQAKKNELMAECEKKLQNEKHRLVRNGLYHSSRYSLLQTKIEAEYEEKIALLRDGLIFYLQYSMRPDATVTPEVDAPYTVDYSLSYEERYYIVRDYYLQAYTDKVARFEAFKADTIALQYLGELYRPLYDYLLNLEA